MKRKVTEFGYMTSKQAMEVLNREMDEACFGCDSGRLRQLDMVGWFLGMFGPGDHVKLLLRKRTKMGTILGWRRSPKWGWCIGMLFNNGDVKDITIDLLTYEDCYAKDGIVKVVKEPERKTIYIIDQTGYIVVIDGRKS